jgi:cell division protein FtsB
VSYLWWPFLQDTVKPPNTGSSGLRLRRSRAGAFCQKCAIIWEEVSPVPPLPLSHPVGRIYQSLIRREALMDLYNTIARWAGWPAIVAILLLAGTYAYFVLHNRLELLRDKNEWFEKQLTELREYSPDILAQRLAERLRILSEELERLTEDHKTSQKSIQDKEAELTEVKAQIANLKAQIEKAQELLRLVSDSGLICPRCGAPLSTREYHADLVEYDGREIDVEHEIIVYECGFEIVDGKTTSECQRSE